MLVVKNKCEDCAHEKVCSLKDSRSQAISQVNDLIQKLQNGGVFTSECPEFSSRPMQRVTPFGTFK